MQASMFNTTCCSLWPSEPQVTLCCITCTDRLSIVSCGMEYPFHFGHSALLIFSFFISNCQIALSPCRSASACLEDNNISVYGFHNNSATLPNMTYFSLSYRSVDLRGCLYWVREIDRLVCLGGHKLPPVLPHNVKSGLHIPLRQTSWRELMRGLNRRRGRDG